VRVLVDGSWGFAGSELANEVEIRRIVSLALENARATRLIQTTPIVLEDVPAYRDDWHMPMKIDVRSSR
jgi:TldD protein